MNESSVQSDILKRLTCPVCLDRYKAPKLLPCQHTFCLSPCLVNLVDRTTRRIKCPECRQIHNLPIQGIDAFPTNITIIRFLDLDLTNVNSRQNEQNLSNSNIVNPNLCVQCNKKQSSLSKCLDCEKLICINCQPIHLAQLKNEAKQSILNLRRILPKLSNNLGNYEQKKTIINQNYESIKKDITSIIEKLIEDLRNRERCLHAEAEVYIQSQLRTISIEKENAEFDLASVSSFCDSSESALNRNDQSLDNEVSLIKKQSINFLQQMANFNAYPVEINRLNLSVTALDDLSNYIKNFGILVVHHQSNDQLFNHMRNISFVNNNNTNGNSNYLSVQNHHQQTQTNRQRPTWNRTNSIEILQNLNETNQTTPRNQPAPARLSYEDRQIFGGGISLGGGSNNTNTTTNNNSNERSNRENVNPATTNSQRVALTPVSFNIQIEPVARNTNRNSNINNNLSNSNNNTNKNNNNNNNSSRENREPVIQMANQTQRENQIRSNTFVLESPNNIDTANNNSTTTTISIPSQNRSETRTEIRNESQVQNLRRRAKTPMTFNVMLDDPSNTLIDDSTPQINLSNVLQTPKINYNNKIRAKTIIGKQGRGDSEFIWPVDVAVNQFNNQIIVSDSNNHRIQIFESDGKFVKTFGRPGNKDGQFNCVSGIFIDSMSNIFVVDRLNHRIQIFDRYCRFVRTIGSGQGSAPGQLNYPWGIAVSRISESKENCITKHILNAKGICVFHMSGRFLRSFGTHGTRIGQFDKPYYIHITKDNKVLVSDCSNHRIQVFDTMGFPLFAFGSEGTNPGEFKHPRGVTSDNEGFWLVADSGNSRIQVFRNDGTYVSHFGTSGSDSGKFRGLEGVTVAANGDIILCDKENHRVQII